MSHSMYSILWSRNHELCCIYIVNHPSIKRTGINYKYLLMLSTKLGLGDTEGRKADKFLLRKH